MNRIRTMRQLRNAIVAGVACVSILLPCERVKGQGSSKRLSSAVDARGVRHRGSEYAGRLPWMNDVLTTVTPEYAYSERAQRHMGSGLFRLTLDLKTGTVKQVSVVKSTGAPALDDSAVDALRRWRWKPGRWQEIDMPITFSPSRTKRGLYIGGKPASR